MVEYKCLRCGYTAKQKNHLINHLKRKNICRPLLENISIEKIKKYYGFENNTQTALFDTQTALFSTQTALFENEKQHPNSTQIAPKQHPNSTQKKLIKCDFCEKTFTRKTGLTKHLKCCKIKKNRDINENEKDKKIKFLEKKQEELQDKVEDLLIELSKNASTINNITNNTTNNTTNNQNKIINININNYGNENIDYLNKDYLNNLLQGAFTAIPKLIENIHFNPSHPENHNIKITNKKEPYVKIRKNDKWELQDKKETLATLVDDKYYILVDHYADVEKTDNIPYKTKKIMEQFHDSYMDNKEIQKDLQKKSEMIILNNS